MDGKWPQSEAEFLALVERVDGEMQEEKLPIPSRPMEALRRISGELRVTIPGPDPREEPTPDSYSGRDFAIRALRWFDATYGERLKMWFSPGRIAVVIRGASWECRIPTIYGVVQLFCSSTEPSYRPDPGSKERPRYNVLDSVQQLPPALRSRLDRSEIELIWSQFMVGYEALTELSNVHGNQLVPTAFEDLDACVHHIVSQHPHYGLAKWAALQATEKILKSYIFNARGSFPKTHDLRDLLGLATRAGLQGVSASLLQMIQCKPDIRYSDASISMEDAVAAQMCALKVAAAVAKQMPRVK